MSSKESGTVRYAYGVATALLLGGTALSIAGAPVNVTLPFACPADSSRTGTSNWYGSASDGSASAHGGPPIAIAPSTPMPVKMAATVRLPYSSAADRRATSTEGRTQWTFGPWSRWSFYSYNK